MIWLSPGRKEPYTLSMSRGLPRPTALTLSSVLCQVTNNTNILLSMIGYQHNTIHDPKGSFLIHSSHHSTLVKMSAELPAVHGLNERGHVTL
jgi:hypothetical protein